MAHVHCEVLAAVVDADRPLGDPPVVRRVSVHLTEAELEVIEALAEHLPEPPFRCPMCQHKFNRPRKETSPDSRKIRAGILPIEKAEAVEDGLDALQAFVGADSTSYARGELLAALVALGASEREYLRVFFQGDADEL